MNSYVDCNDQESKECLEEFTKRINQQMTLNCQIPFSLPVAAIAQIVGEAKRYFYNAYDDAVEEIFLSCPGEVFQHPSFKFGLTNKTMDGNKMQKSETQKDRGVLVMPENVFSVIRVYQLNRFSGEGGWGAGTRLNGGNLDYSVRRMFASSMYNDRLPMAADNLMYWTCNMVFYDTARQMLQEMNSFSYNRLTHKLRFTGELPKFSCIFQTLCAIPDCDLFSDDLFFRYCVAMCMKHMARILGMFQYNLPGNVSINYDMYSQWGDSEIQEIKEEISQNRHSVSYFFTT